MATAPTATERGTGAGDGRVAVDSARWGRPRPALGLALFVGGMTTWVGGSLVTNVPLQWTLWTAGAIVATNAIPPLVGTRVTGPFEPTAWTFASAFFLIAQALAYDGLTAVLLVAGGLTVIAAGVTWLLAELRRNHEQLAEAAMATERQQVAADVHDIVGHSLAVTMLHLNAARMSLQDDPGAAVEALEEAERSGRSGMDEIRGVVRLLRSDDGASAHSPPDLTDLPALIATLQGAGATIRVARTGADDQLTQLMSTTMYRLVQEGLTNAVKHGAGPIDVRLATTAEAIELEIRNPIDRVHSRSAYGTGLDSARSRAETLGGTFAAGPTGTSTEWRFAATLFP